MSPAEAVVRRSPRPVLVVPAGAGGLDARRPVTILAAGSDATGDAWVDVLRRTFAANVVRAPDTSQCAPDRVQRTDLIVLSMRRSLRRDCAGAEGVCPSGAVLPLN